MSRILHFVFLLALSPAVSAQQQFSELGGQALPRANTWTSAVAAGDIDLDGDVDLVCATYGQARLYLNDGAGVFVDMTRQLPANLTPTTSVALADLDGDRDLDLVLGTYSTNLLYLNVGRGLFVDASGQLPSRFAQTNAIVAADVDRDGDLDLLTGNHVRNSLYLNNGKATFVDATDTKLPRYSAMTSALAVGDVDGDGDLDFVSGDSALNGANTVFLNDGNGTFSISPNGLGHASDNTTTLALGDVDADRDLDLVVGNGYGNGPIRIYLNDSRGTFTEWASFTGGSQTTSLALGDLDRDGDLDLFVGNGLSITTVAQKHGFQDRLFLGDGKGNFSDATASKIGHSVTFTESVALADVDRNGTLDVILGCSVLGTAPFGGQDRILLNDGNARLSDATASQIPLAYSVSNAVAAGDVDGDGDLDLVFGTDLRNQQYLNDGKGFFVEDLQGPTQDSHITNAVVLADVDGDGDLDLFTGNWLSKAGAAPNQLYRNDGKGRYERMTDVWLPLRWTTTVAAAMGDLDGDGDVDLVNGNYSDPDRLFLNDGSGTFTDASPSALPNHAGATLGIALGDVDHDGDLDVVIAKELGTGRNRLLLNDGKARFTDATVTALPWDNGTNGDVTFADINGDGALDLIVGTPLRILLNDKQGKFTDTTAVALPGQVMTTGVAITDIDEDGDADLVTASWFPTFQMQNKLFLNDGHGRFTDATQRLPSGPTITLGVVAGDMDGDGDPDLVFAEHDGSNRIYLNLHRHLDAPLVPKLGQGYLIELYATPGYGTVSTFAVPFFSQGESRLPIPPFGTFGLDVVTLIPLPVERIDPQLGKVSRTYPVPQDVSLVGTRAFSQALIATDVLRPRTWRFTNVRGDRVR